jgi:predicted nucleotidyltransferase
LINFRVFPERSESILKIAGIIAEYNPFHRGHQWQIAALRRQLGDDAAVIAVMSGNWVQRGDAALVEKHQRARLALLGGVDLVVELPLPWAVSSAERFAQGGVKILEATGLVDTLVFGSESGNLPALREMADYLLTEDYRMRLKAALKTGCSFAAARQQAMEAGHLPAWDTAQAPNDQLALEYLKALGGTGIQPLAIPRKGASHDGEAREGIASASVLREMILAGEDAGDYLLPGTAFAPEELASLSYGEKGVLSTLRRMGAEDFAALPDCSEGLEHRMAKAARQATSIPELCALAKTKRYAYARLRRLVTWGYLGLTQADFPASPACIRVLGANSQGIALLHRMKQTARLPVVTKPTAARSMSAEVRRQLELEARATDLWQLCKASVGPGGTEWKTGIVLL